MDDKSIAMNIDEFRESCLSLPGTTEKMPFKKFKAARSMLVFYVCDKMYFLIDSDRFESCTVKCQTEQVEALKARYNGITEPYNMSHKYWIGITFDPDVDVKLLKQLIKNSHDIVDFILHGCTDVKQNLRELYRRVAFNVLFGNTDDHFRNHGFILTPKGWTLSPAYDINPSTQTYQCLLINKDTENSDINVLQDSCESYMLDATEASDIISQVKNTIRDWQRIATENQIPVRILQEYTERWKCQSSSKNN